MTKVIITVRIKATNYCLLTINRVVLRAAERLRHLLFPPTLASIGPIWVDDLQEMYDFHPLPFLTLLSYNFFPLRRYSLFWQKTNPAWSLTYTLWSPNACASILEDSRITSQAISWSVVHVASEIPETTLCMLGGIPRRTHTCTHTQMIYHKYLKTERCGLGSLTITLPLSARDESQKRNNILVIFTSLLTTQQPKPRFSFLMKFKV